MSKNIFLDMAREDLKRRDPLPFRRHMDLARKHGGEKSRYYWYQYKWFAAYPDITNEDLVEELQNAVSAGDGDPDLMDSIHKSLAYRLDKIERGYP